MSKISIYVISDTHFNHNNIIKCCNRPFQSLAEMDEYMINEWNKTVTNDDIVIHCGDFAFGGPIELRNYAKKLNGIKILIPGNHEPTNKLFLRIGGFKVGKKKLYCEKIIKSGILNKYVFSHMPLENHLISEGMINLHGHIHNQDLDKTLSKDTHKCISVECINYKPLKIY